MVGVAVALSLAARAILIVVAALVVALPLPEIALGSAVAGANQPVVDGAGRIAVLLTDSTPALSTHAFGTTILHLIDMTMLNVLLHASKYSEFIIFYNSQRHFTEAEQHGPFGGPSGLHCPGLPS